MDWHIINHRDYIDGPFASFEDALAEALILGNESGTPKRLNRRANEFFVYKPPYDRKERWQPEYWICTKEAALAQGASEALFAGQSWAA
ncbi:MAG: hypothetical protein ACR2I2_12105 [Bryobacteraceae bacterium]|nr:hypothetical protein [Acidobacteriota bacterium]